MSGRTLINLVTFLASLIDHVIPIPKTNNPEQVKDFRLVIKTIEKLAKSLIVPNTDSPLDPLQFA